MLIRDLDQVRAAGCPAAACYNINDNRTKVTLFPQAILRCHLR